MNDLLPPDDSPPTPEEMVRFLDEEIYGAATWLQQFSHGHQKRPDHELDAFKRRLRLRKWARYGYARLAEANARRQSDAQA